MHSSDHQHGSGKQGDATLWRALSAQALPWTVPRRTDDWLLAIDDTDNLQSRGTGFRARELALQLAEQGLARPRGITRHQLLVDPRIPYTSHNSSACLVLGDVADPQRVFEYGCDYLADAAAEGSDAAVVVAPAAQVAAAVRLWGRRAKVEVLDQDGALALAAAEGLRIAQLTGTGGGVIGALAAVGLNADGHDGRFLWIARLRESAGRELSAAELAETCGVQARSHRDARAVAPDHRIDLGAWPRAVLLDQRPVLLVEPSDETRSDHWRVIDRDLVKAY